MGVLTKGILIHRILTKGILMHRILTKGILIHRILTKGFVIHRIITKGILIHRIIKKSIPSTTNCIAFLCRKLSYRVFFQSEFSNRRLQCREFCSGRFLHRGCTVQSMKALGLKPNSLKIRFLEILVTLRSAVKSASRTYCMRTFLRACTVT